VASGAVAAAKVSETQAQIFNARLDAALCGLFLILVSTILIDSLRIWAGILGGSKRAPVTESPFVASRLQAEQL
jgi:carbon starvation protein